jgi:hypothetical protein
MELIAFEVLALVGGALFAGVVWVVIWKATGNAFDWVIHTFGNVRAATQIEEKWRNREGK